MRLAFVLASVLLCGACPPGGGEGASPSTPPARASASHRQSRGAASGVLADLRRRLERVRAAEAQEHVVQGPADVAGLRGMERSAIVRALGAPHACVMQAATECTGHPMRCRTAQRPSPAPCQRPSDVFYSFYHLPDGSNGGGPELLLRFDAEQRCVEAEWRYTQ